MMRDQKWTPGSAAVLDTLLRRGGPAITAEAKLVYLALFSYMGADYTSRPSVATLAEGTCLSERTVQRVLKELEAGRLVAREPRFDTEGRRTSTLYHMAPPWAITRPLQDQEWEGDSLTPPPDTETPPGVREAPAPDSGTQEERQSDTIPPSDSHPPGDSVTPKVTHLKEPNEGDEGGGGADKAPVVSLQPKEERGALPQSPSPEPMAQIEDYLKGRTVKLLLSGRDITEIQEWLKLTDCNVEVIKEGIDAGLKLFQHGQPGGVPDGAAFYRGYVRKAWDRHRGKEALEYGRRAEGSPGGASRGTTGQRLEPGRNKGYRHGAADSGGRQPARAASGASKWVRPEHIAE